MACGSGSALRVALVLWLCVLAHGDEFWGGKKQKLKKVQYTDPKDILCQPYKPNPVWTERVGQRIHKAKKFFRKITSLLDDDEKDNTKGMDHILGRFRYARKKDGKLTAKKIKAMRHPVLFIPGFGGTKLASTTDKSGVGKRGGYCPHTERLWLPDLTLKHKFKGLPLNHDRKKQDALRLYWVPDKPNKTCKYVEQCPITGRYMQHVSGPLLDRLKKMGVPQKITRCDVVPLSANARCDVYRNKYLGLGTKHSPVSAEASGLAAVTDLVEGGGVRAVLRALPFVGAGKQLRGPTKFFNLLISIGYTPGKDLFAAPYDFRFAPDPDEKEQRLGKGWRKKCDESYHHADLGVCHFRKLARLIIAMAKKNKKPVMIYAHSNGNNVVTHLLRFVDPPLREELYKSIAGYASLAGPHLGSMKAIEALTSGTPFGGGMVEAATVRHLSKAWGSQGWNFPREPAHPFFESKTRRVRTGQKPLITTVQLQLTDAKIELDNSLAIGGQAARTGFTQLRTACTALARAVDSGYEIKCGDVHVPQSTKDMCAWGVAVMTRMKVYSKAVPKGAPLLASFFAWVKSRGKDTFDSEIRCNAAAKVQPALFERFLAHIATAFKSASSSGQQKFLEKIFNAPLKALVNQKHMNLSPLRKYARVEGEKVGFSLGTPRELLNWIRGMFTRSKNLVDVAGSFESLFNSRAVEAISPLNKPCLHRRYFRNRTLKRSHAGSDASEGCIPVYGFYSRVQRSHLSRAKQLVKFKSYFSKTWKDALMKPEATTPIRLELQSQLLADAERDAFTPSFQTTKFTLLDKELGRGDGTLSERSTTYVCRAWSASCLQMKGEHTEFLDTDGFVDEAVRLALDPQRNKLEYQDPKADPQRKHAEEFGDRDKQDQKLADLFVKHYERVQSERPEAAKSTLETVATKQAQQEIEGKEEVPEKGPVRIEGSSKKRKTPTAADYKLLRKKRRSFEEKQAARRAKAHEKFLAKQKSGIALDQNGGAVP